MIIVDDLEVHSPRRGAEVSLANVERRVEQLANKYYRAEVHFDPTNASLMMENLRGRRLTVHEFRFSAPVNDRVTNLLHHLFRDGNIALPDHPPLLDEILSVRVVETRLGGLKIDTRSGGHDDQVDALSICSLVLMDRPLSNGTTGTVFSDLPPMPIRGAFGRAGVATVIAPWERSWEDRIRGLL